MVNLALPEFGRQRKKLPVGQSGHSGMERGTNHLARTSPGVCCLPGTGDPHRKCQSASLTMASHGKEAEGGPSGSRPITAP